MIGPWLTDLNAHAAIVGVMRRAKGAGAFTQVLPAGHAQSKFPGAPEIAFEASELPAVIVYDSKGRNRVGLVLTTRRVAVLASDAPPKWLVYADIETMGPAPPSRRLDSRPRVLLHGRRGEQLLLELEPGAPCNAVLLAIENRTQAAREAEADR